MEKDETVQSQLQLVRGAGNPGVSPDTLVFLLKGDATGGTLSLEVPAELQFPAAWQYKQQPFRLKLLHFNDLHGRFLRIGQRETSPVFSRIAARIQQVRSGCQDDPFAGVLVLSGGDDLIGSPFDLLAHAGYRLYSKAGVDAAALGNHEFDLGLDALAGAIRQEARFPILSANLRPATQLEGLCFPAAIFVLKGVRIGVIGLTTPAENRSRPGSAYELVDPIPVVKGLLPVMRPLCEVVILLSHLGLSLDSCTAATAFAGDVELAQSLPYGSVDLIVGGHTHDPLNEGGLSPKNVVNGIPLVQAGNKGRFLGEVEFVLRPAPTLIKAGLTFAADQPVDAAFEKNYVQPFFEQIRPHCEKKLGVVANSQEMRAETYLDHAACAESALHNFVADGLVARSRAHGFAVDLAMVDADSFHSELPIGRELTYGDWLRLLPYANTLVLLTLTGQELLALIQDNARRIDLPGEPHIERGFQHFSKEVRYCIRRAPLRSQIAAGEIFVRGISLVQSLDRNYLVACFNSFRMMARNWEKQVAAQLPLLVFEPKEAQAVDTGIFTRELLVEQIQQYAGVTPEGGAARDGRVIIC